MTTRAEKVAYIEVFIKGLPKIVDIKNMPLNKYFIDTSFCKLHNLEETFENLHIVYRDDNQVLTSWILFNDYDCEKLYDRIINE